MPDSLTSIFISYAHADSPFVDRLEADLRQQGFAPWVDRHGLAGGHKWRRALQSALDHAQVVLVVLSPEAVASEYVQNEYGYASEEGKVLIPLYYRSCKVPLELRGIQWIDFQHPYEQGLAALLQALHSQPEPAALSVAETESRPERLQQAAFNNLPTELTPFIGREDETQTAGVLLRQPQLRLLTLTGTGGIGKTRLALHLAAELLADFADGVALVALASITDPDLVVPTIAHTFAFREVADYSLPEQLKAYLREKQVLLVLDNFEQVIEAAVPMAELLAACPRLKLLVTSRIVLHIQAEREFPVLPLSLPDPKRLPDLVTLSQYEAVALFIQRAQAVKLDFAVTNENAPAVAGICARLDGLPLAIELAAARVKYFAPQALFTRLGQGLAVLTGGARDLPARQQTLRGAIAWSYDLLSLQEQALFRRLAVFVDGWTWEAADVVCQAAGALEIDVLEGLLSLVDKSLLRQQESEQGEPRFWMLQVLREFGLEVLTKAGEREATRRAHADYFLALAEEAEPELSGPNQVAWTQRLEQEHDNLRAALGWTSEQGEQEGGLRLAGALHSFWFRRGHLSEGRQWLSTLLASEHPGAAAVRAKALLGAGYLALRQGDYSQAKALLEESVALYREVGDTGGLAYALHELGGLAGLQDDYGQARALFEESLALSREVGDTVGIARTLLDLGTLARLQEDYSQARTLLEESLALFRELGHKGNIAYALNALGVLARLQGDYSQARVLFEESLALQRELEVKDFLAWALVELGILARLQEDYSQARTLLEESLALSRELGNKDGIAEGLRELGTLARLQGDDGQAQALLKESLSLSRELGDKAGIAGSLEGLAEVARVQADPGPAARLFGAAEAVREAIGASLPPLERASYAQALASVRAQLGEDAFAAAWQEGRATELSQIIEEALKTGDETSNEEQGTVHEATPKGSGGNP